MYEQGPIRPPSEASSLLVRVTRNCPWNRCLTCPAYKGASFSKRSIDEIKKDIDGMAKSYGAGAGKVKSAFLQDADSLILPTSDLIAVIEHMKLKFSGLKRITTYARAKSMKKKSMESYRALKEAGLNRIHSGMESGSINVLKMIQKGTSPEEILAGGLRVKESGISLSEYIMPGVGGRSLSREHAVETAKLLNYLQPDFIRVRTFAIPPASPMQGMVTQGKFVPMDDVEIVSEIKVLLSELNEMHSYFRCGDFSLNLLMHVDGYLDTHKKAMTEEIEKFLTLNDDQKRAMILYQRLYPSISISMDGFEYKAIPGQIRNKIVELDRREDNGFNKYIRALMSHQLPQPLNGNWT